MKTRYSSLSVTVFALCAMLWISPLLSQPVSAHTITVPASLFSEAVAPLSPTHVTQLSAACSTYYTVRAGNTLSLIGRRYGLSWQALQNANHIANANWIRIGQVLCIPSGGAASGGSPSPSPQPPPVTYSTGASFGPCQSSATFLNVGVWNRPGSCYGNVYAGVWWNGQADCFALAQYYTHGHVAQLAVHWSPVVGAVIFFQPGVLGASSVGHYGVVVAIARGWMLVLNQNDFWNGGGYARQNYRFVPISTRGIYYRY